MSKLVKAKEVEWGQCFRKKTGSYVYLRISEPSAKFHKLDPEKVYGVCFNGNITDIDPETLVVTMKPSDMDDNRKEHQDWHTMVGADFNEI